MKRNSAASELVTKSFLRSELDDLKKEIDEKAQGYRDEVLTSNDKLAKTLETIREDIEIGNFQMKRKVDNHEARIKRLEKIPQAA